MALRSAVSHLTIAVPFELKRRMDQVPVCVNWSEVACRAFEAWLADARRSGTRSADAERSEPAAPEPVANYSSRLPAPVLLGATVAAAAGCLLFVGTRRISGGLVGSLVLAALLAEAVAQVVDREGGHSPKTRGDRDS